MPKYYKTTVKEVGLQLNGRDLLPGSVLITRAKPDGVWERVGKVEVYDGDVAKQEQGKAFEVATPEEKPAPKKAPKKPAAPKQPQQAES